MKKGLKILLSVVVVILGLKFGLDYALDSYWKANYSGPLYYTKITSNTPYTKKKFDDGKGYYYEYNVEATNAHNKVKKLTFNEHLDRPLKINSYIKFVVNDKKGVTEWNAVESNELPKNIRTKIIETQ